MTKILPILKTPKPREEEVNSNVLDHTADEV